MHKDIEKSIKELSEEADRLIVDPDDLEQLKSHGIPFEVVPSPTIGQLFDLRKEKAFAIAPHLPGLPERLPPAIQALYQEIRECIFFGLYGAAITMSSVLIEYVIKHATYITEAGDYKKADPQKWGEFENMEMSRAINRARKVGLLDSGMARRLHSFRETIRNPYAHYNIREIPKNVVAEKVKQVNLRTGEVLERDIEAKNDPSIQAQVKPLMDEHRVLPVLHFADEVVKYLLPKIPRGTIKSNM